MIYQLSDLNASDRLTGFIGVLNYLAQSKECRELLPAPTPVVNTSHDMKKINAIYDHLIRNFTRKVYIEELATIANMNSSSFCRYFKKVNKKTVIEFIIELRINYACKLLLENKFSITQIAFECGFGNPAMFFRKFKEITGVRPSQYKKRYLPG